MIILKAAIKQSFILSLEDIFLEKPQGAIKLTPRSLFWVNIYWFYFSTMFMLLVISYITNLHNRNNIFK